MGTASLPTTRSGARLCYVMVMLRLYSSLARQRDDAPNDLVDATPAR